MDSTTLSNLSAAQFRRAAEIKENIEALQNELAGLLGAAPTAIAAAVRTDRKRTLSPAAIARIRAAQKARWAAHRSAQGGGATAVKAQPKRKMSPAARARLAAIAKARWAKVRAQGRNAL
jgi:hypothetical protein